MLRFLEFAVFRSAVLQRPYGDHSLLIHRERLAKVGGYRLLALMEDLDLVQLVPVGSVFRRIGQAGPPVRALASVLRNAWCNLQLRRRWLA